MIKGIHHIAIICSDYPRSKWFYTEVLGLQVIREIYREQRESFKLDLGLNGQYIVELFSFPRVPTRPSYPEAAGLRHLAFAVDNLDRFLEKMEERGINHEPIRTDLDTGKRFCFIADPDGLPLEFYEV